MNLSTRAKLCHGASSRTDFMVEVMRRLATVHVVAVFVVAIVVVDMCSIIIVCVCSCYFVC